MISSELRILSEGNEEMSSETIENDVALWQIAVLFQILNEMVGCLLRNSIFRQ